MKLFNAQSTKKQNKNTESTTVAKTLDAKVLINKDLLVAVAGGLNDTVSVWPPITKNK